MEVSFVEVNNNNVSHDEIVSCNIRYSGCDTDIAKPFLTPISEPALLSTKAWNNHQEISARYVVGVQPPAMLDIEQLIKTHVPSSPNSPPLTDHRTAHAGSSPRGIARLHALMSYDR